MTRARYEAIGMISIDSGQVCIGDPCYLRTLAPHTLNLADGLSKQIEECVVSSTGMGDGLYPVFAKIRDGRILSLFIDFEIPDA